MNSSETIIGWKTFHEGFGFTSSIKKFKSTSFKTLILGQWFCVWIYAVCKIYKLLEEDSSNFKYKK